MTNKPIAAAEPGKILITGGCGFIGSNLAAHYLAKGWEVDAFDNFARLGAETNAAWLAEQGDGRLSIVIGDVRNFGPVCEAVQGVDVVVHLAAQVGVSESIADPREDFMINAQGGLNVLEAVRGCGSDPVVLYASTRMVYGDLSRFELRDLEQRYEYADEAQQLSGIAESTPIDLRSPNACSKGALDHYMLEYARAYGMKTVVFRLSSIYGPHQFGADAENWVSHFVISALMGQPISIDGDGKQVRDILHVRDLATAVEAAATNIEVCRGQAYNLGGGPENSLSSLELVAILEARLGRAILLQYRSSQNGDQKLYLSNTQKAERDLNWRPTVDLKDGLEKLGTWVEANAGLFGDLQTKERALPSKNAFEDTRPTGTGQASRATPLPSLNAAESKARRVKAVTANLKKSAE